MKSILLVLFMVSFMFVISCADEKPATTANSAATKKMGIKIKDWKEAAIMPIPDGFEESIGVSGAYAGFIGDKMIVAGGANFPYGSVLEGTPKEFYSDIFVFDVASDGTLEVVGRGHLPKKLATGNVVKPSDDMLYFIGGENADGDSATVYAITIDAHNKPIVEEKFDLPFTFAAGGAVLDKDKLYLLGGRQNKGASDKVFEIDMNSMAAKELTPIPSGEKRVQVPHALVDGKIYVFSGLGSTTLTDAYAYDIASGNWTTLSSTTMDGMPYALAGGAAIPVDNDNILILGGVNKQVFDDAVSNLNTLKGDDLEAFRQDYFNRTPEQYNFGKNEVVYNISGDKFKSIGQIPFYGNAGPFPILIDDDMNVYRVSGEIKAGVRVPDIQVGKIVK